jgi:hypothetical protein
VRLTRQRRSHAWFASSMITAATPPMKGESGFLNTHYDTESGDKTAGSRIGREKSMRDRSIGSSSTRAAASELLCNGKAG